MSTTIATNAGDPSPRKQGWAKVDEYVDEFEQAEPAVRRYFLNDWIESTDA